MPNPEVTTIKAVEKYAHPKSLFRHRDTGELCVRVPRGHGSKDAWISLHTTDRLEAMRRLERTGVGQVIDVAQDERFKDRVVEVLTSTAKVPVEAVVDEWIADLKLRLHRNSMSNYTVIGGQFLRLFAPQTCITTITPQRVNAWINTAPSMTRRRRRMSVLESLFQFAFDRGYRKDNAGKRLGMQTSDLTFEQMEREIVEPFTQEEYDRLLAGPKTTGFWKAAVMLGWWLGLRMSDCCNLQWGSFCAVPGKIVVWQTKTRRRLELDERDPVLGGGIISQLIGEMRAEATDAVYCFPDFHELYENQQQQLVPLFRSVCIAAHLDGVKTFRCMRKSAAQRWKKEGRSLKDIGSLLGHEGTGNTAFYLETKK